MNPEQIAALEAAIELAKEKKDKVNARIDRTNTKIDNLQVYKQELVAERSALNDLIALLKEGLEK